jgi:hypothetical protein
MSSTISFPLSCTILVMALESADILVSPLLEAEQEGSQRLLLALLGSGPLASRRKASQKLARLEIGSSLSPQS